MHHYSSSPLKDIPDIQKIFEDAHAISALLPEDIREEVLAQLLQVFDLGWRLAMLHSASRLRSHDASTDRMKQYANDLLRLQIAFRKVLVERLAEARGAAGDNGQNDIC